MVLKIIKPAIMERLRLLKDPKAGLRQKKSLETSVYEYLVLLVSLAVLAGAVGFLVVVSKSLYVGLVYDADINYLHMLNYAAGRSTGILFFYIFSGTFLVFFISIILNALLRKIKYTHILHTLLMSMSPILLFGWIPLLAYAFVIWSGFLFITGVNDEKS